MQHMMVGASGTRANPGHRVSFKELVKGALARLGVLDYCIFILEDRIKRFRPSRLSRNLWYRIRGAPDGLPIPPGYLLWLVVGSSNVQAFLDSGVIHAHEVIWRTLEENGLALEHFGTILDFGCGCGRIMRYWKDLQHARLYGSDYNPTLIRWCRRHLPFAQFEVNHLAPPLSFQTGQFDFVYARSVFTHFAEDLQFAWIAELRRVLKPGGHLLFTVSGDRFLDSLTPSEAERYRAGHLVVRDEEMAGKNYCAVYHPPQYVRQVLLSEKFDVLDLIPGDAAKPYCLQDTYLLRRR
jgi:SAM-dependent methyltransferase